VGLVGVADLPPGASRVEFELTPTPVGTRLDLTHTGLPGTRAETHGAGWANYLARLRHVAIGADPGPDTWRAVTTSRTGGDDGSDND
jgi:Activator of Hsp90 ATPase homolog 1-like protein